MIHICTGTDLQSATAGYLFLFGYNTYVFLNYNYPSILLHRTMPVSRKTRGVARGNAKVGDSPRAERRQHLNDGDGKGRARSDAKRGHSKATAEERRKARVEAVAAQRLSAQREEIAAEEADERKIEATYTQSVLKIEEAIVAGEARVLALQKQIQARRAEVLPPQHPGRVGVADPLQDGALTILPFQPFRPQETDSRFDYLSIRFPDISVLFFKAISENTLAPTDILQLSNEYTPERENMNVSKLKSTLLHEALKEEEEEEAFSCEFGGPTHLLLCFLIYCAILLHFTPAAMRYQLSIGLFAYQDRFLGHSMIYTWESVRSYHFIFHKLRLLENIADGAGWSRVDTNLEALHLVRR